MASHMDLQAVALQELSLPAVLDAVSTFCLTDMGKLATRQLTPHTSLSEAQHALDLVADAIGLLTTGDGIPLEHFPDIHSLLSRSRIVGNFLTAPELLNVHEAMVASRILRRYLASQADAAPSLHELSTRLIDDKVIEKHLTDAIDDTGLVRDTASRELLSIRRDIHSLEQRLRSRIQHLMKKFGEDELLQDEFVTQREGRFVLPLLVQNKNAVNGIIHGVSQSGQTVFLEPAETFELNNELSIMRGREQREIINILTTLTAEIGGISKQLDDAALVLVEVDCILARARYALEFGGVKPVLTEHTDVELDKVRHPLLLHQARHNWDVTASTIPLAQAQQNVVPLSVRIDSVHRGILISGPNAGGKTVAMKTMGLSLAMAYAGIFPLGSCTAPIRRLYTSIGDHQSIDANLSTFSSQIIRLRDILSETDSEALVLIDEICAGTDPAEGGALAAGILDSLLERGSSFVVTTHQSSLKQYALTHDRITNASLAFDDEKMVPTFRFLYGVPGNSYAFDLARTVGLPDIVITRGKQYLGDRHDELETSIAVMQRYREEAEKLKLEAAREHATVIAVRKDYEERSAKLKAQRSTSIQEAKQQAAEILAKANALIENTIREVREQQKAANDIKRTFEQAKTELVAGDKDDASLQAEPVSPQFAVDDTVRIIDTATSGTITAIDERGHAVVDVHGITMRVALDKLEIVQQAKAPTSKKQEPRTGATLVTRPTDDYHADRGTKPPSQTMPVSLTLDLRGQRAEEALKQLEQFVDAAVVRGAPFLSIIHGKGTGVLREVVHQFLERQSSIRSFRLGSIPEGGDGITIVEL